MTALVEMLRGLAFHRASAAEANTAIDAARTLKSNGEREGVSYEIALPAMDPDTYLGQRALPKLTYFLDCRGIRLPASGDVFVSLFCEAELLFIEAGPFVEAVASARGLTLAEVVRRYGADGVGEPALLGG